MSILSMRRRCAGEKKSKYLMTATSNPEMFAICFANGWCSAEGMTYEQAAAVTSLGNAFCMNNKDITHFEEFEYFTGVTILQTNSFRGATNLKSIVFPNSLVRIRDYCFESPAIEDYDTKNVYYISTSGSFKGCDSVKKIRIGSALNVMYAPNSSKSLVEIEVDSENEYYETDGKSLIYKPTKTLVITTNDVSDIPEGVEVIRESSMREIHVKTLTLSSTVNSIGKYFLYHSSVTNLISKAVVPPTTTANTFYSATITNIYVPDESVEAYKTAPYWDALASKIQPMSLLLPMMTTATNAKVLSVCYANGWCESPDYMTYAEAKNVTYIPINTFSENTDIVSFDELEFFTGLKNGLIGSTSTVLKGVFQSCTSLKSIKLPENLRSIGVNTFRRCTSLQNIKIPSGVTIIYESAFFGTNLISVEIPSSVTRIDRAAFRNSTNVQYVKVLATAPPTLSTMNFVEGNYPNAPIYVPDESVELYKAATNWSALASRIRPISEFVQT